MAGETKKKDGISINIERIIEAQLDRFSNDPNLRKKFPKDILTLKQQWADFCTIYKKVAKEAKRDNNTGRNARNNKKTEYSSRHKKKGPTSKGR